MSQSLKVPIAILSIAPLILIGGCDDRATRIAQEAADRQAQQNTTMAELNQEVAGGARQLVDADAQARQEIVGVHRDLQAERTRLDTGWSALQEERQQIASQRRTESMIAPAITVVGGVLLVVALLGFCWYALAAARRDDNSEELNELLICEVLSGDQPLLPSDRPHPPMLAQADDHEMPE